MSMIKKEVTVTGTLGQKKIEALFDSGSGTSLIKEDVAKEIGNIITAPGRKELIQADGSRFETNKVLPAVLDIKGCSFPTFFWVFPDLQEDLIIGTDIMQNKKIKLDFEKDDVDVSECTPWDRV